MTVDFCNWCPDPHNPSPVHHPNGTTEHIPIPLEPDDYAEICAQQLIQYSRCLRGREFDYTGVGIHQMIIDNFERALGVKVLTKDQWEYYKDK